MRFSRMLNVVDAHAEGESGKVVVSAGPRRDDVRQDAPLLRAPLNTPPCPAPTPCAWQQ